MFLKLQYLVASTGLTIDEIDNIVSFDHRGNELALMHCVSIYPIPTKDFQLNFIDVLKERYKGQLLVGLLMKIKMKQLQFK